MRRKNIFRILVALLVVAIIAVIVGYRLWTKPHERVEDSKGIAITADALCQAFSANENAANAKYLNKAIEVTGIVNEIDKNQDGGTMVILQTNDPIMAVQCTMRDKGANIEKGKAVTLKGFCSGTGITGVTLTDCIAKNQ